MHPPLGTQYRSWLNCATSRKVEGSNQGVIIEFFFSSFSILPNVLGAGVKQKTAKAKTSRSSVAVVIVPFH
jgi:hypothetical protein